ncbi:MAG: replicative DNA helicase [Alphaproteobacteria bacterium]|mgnify:CR=1 FL=1|nr:replicative DNA helicase [Alphaproteobacteria bacterium]|tara:strand:+ start:7516 stop:9051 length:1536 start_codon:yes stop_codon:yes gene_type:complete
MMTSDTSDLENSPNNITPLREDRDDVSFKVMPHNYEAEMALIGAILTNNRAYERVQEFLLPEHFADPAHAKVYESCATLIDRGQLADPVTLKNYFTNEASLEQVGGQSYIAELANSVITIQNSQDLGREIYDCFLRRELIEIGEILTNNAFDHDLDIPATQQIEVAESHLFELAEKGTSESGFQEFKTAITSAIDLAAAAYRKDTDLVGVPSGFKDIDRLLGGFHRSDLVIIAGRPSMGKTALATNIAYNAASSVNRSLDTEGNEIEEREVVAFFSLEMSAEQLATRIISEQAHVRSDSIRRGDVSEEEYNRVFVVSQALHKLKLFIDDTPALTVSQIRTRARRLKRQNGLSMIIVDYLQLVAPPGNSRNENRVQEVSVITRSLKALAKELNVPVIALSQLSRAVEQREEKRPQLSDLRESGSIEQDSDVVMFLYREEYYLDRESRDQREHETDEKFAKRLERLENSRNKAEVIVGKQRHGPIGTAHLRFNGDFTQFSDLALDDRIPEDRH